MEVDPVHDPALVPATRRRIDSIVDVLVAGGSATAITVFTSVAAERNESSALAAYLLGIILGGLLFFRRRQPVRVLVLSMIVVMGYNLTGLPGISPIWSLLVPLYTVARHGQLLLGAAVGTSLEIISTGWVLNSDVPPLEILDGAIQETAVLGVVLVAGAALRNKERFAQEFTARLAAEREQQQREAARRILEERLRIARELHDVTAHTVAVVGIQVNLARELVTDDPDTARELLDNARQLNLDAVGELQAAVRLLRADGTQPEPDRRPMPDESQIPDLLDRAAESGLTVEFDRQGEPRPVPPAVGLTLYRITQESVTNALRHADADTLQVSLRYEADGVGLDVIDDGRGSHPADGSDSDRPGGAGYGLAGMQERVSSLGGRLTVGPAPERGFAVRAWLPLSKAGTSAAPETPSMRTDPSVRH
ncbi:sensor histidine kinase [Micromonospora sp. NBC_01739]|nr:sensor histidine kinase [Micromonospora sp. NBC_01739]